MPKVKVELALHVNEMVKLIKEEYGAKSASKALEKYFQENDPDLALEAVDRAHKTLERRNRRKSEDSE